MENKEYNPLYAYGNFKDKEIPADEKVKITREAEVPKGEYCDWCREQGTKIQQFISPWNDVVTGQEEYRWCYFYNQRLYHEKTECCNPRNKKCLPCLIATNDGYKIAECAILSAMLGMKFKNDETEELKNSHGNIVKKPIYEVYIKKDEKENH